MTRGSFQCLRKQMTWMLLYGTLNTHNNTSAGGYRSTALKEVSLVIGLCKSHQSSSTGTQNTDYMIQKFCQLLPLLCSQTQDEPYPTTEKVTQRSLIEALALRSPSFYSTIIKESANISVRF